MIKPRVYVTVVSICLVAALFLRQTEQAVVPTIDVLPHRVRVLLPGQLCDNLQGTLQFHIQSFLSLPYNNRLAQLEQIVQVRETMREKGCG